MLPDLRAVLWEEALRISWLNSEGERSAIVRRWRGFVVAEGVAYVRS